MYRPWRDGQGLPRSSGRNKGLRTVRYWIATPALSSHRNQRCHSGRMHLSWRRMRIGGLPARLDQTTPHMAAMSASVSRRVPTGRPVSRRRVLPLRAKGCVVLSAKLVHVCACVRIVDHDAVRRGWLPHKYICTQQSGPALHQNPTSPQLREKTDLGLGL